MRTFERQLIYRGKERKKERKDEGEGRRYGKLETDDAWWIICGSHNAIMSLILTIVPLFSRKDRVNSATESYYANSAPPVEAV